MKISIGVINFNRLFYLKSFTKSLVTSLGSIDPSKVELICIDDDSKESGTSEYLEYLSQTGWNIIHQGKRRTEKKAEASDNVAHINPFAEALNIIYRESSGDLVYPSQGDTQFIRKGWLEEVVNLFENKQDVGVCLIDAQRKTRLDNLSGFNHLNINGFDYFVDIKNKTMPSTGDSIYSRSFLDSLNGWTVKRGVNSEVDMVRRSTRKGLKKYSLKVPAIAAIYTDPIGTNARIRGGKRYGKYWQAKDDQYYHFINPNDFSECLHRPYSIEEVVKADWALPIDENGNWKKNPIEVTESTAYENIS